MITTVIVKFGVAVISACLLSVSPVIKEFDLNNPFGNNLFSRTVSFYSPRDYVLDIFKMTTVATEVICADVGQPNLICIGNLFV